MKLTLTSWSFPRCTLEEAAGIARSLGFTALDIGAFPGGHLNRDVLLSKNARSEAKRVRDLGLAISNVYFTFGAGFAERALNTPDAKIRAKNREDFKRTAAFCADVGAPSIMLLPGILHKGQSHADALDTAADAINSLLPISQNAGVIIAIEPHVMSVLESPQDTLKVIQATGVELALDHAHFVMLGYTQAEIDPLCAHAAHVHLRQSKPGFLQTRLEHGTLNFPRLLGTLRQANYAGYLALEYVHQDYLQTDNVDVISETIKLRDLVQEYG
jgi:sugar phosphate isomerase/epimerase